MAKIQFENKVALNENASIPDVNKCKVTDMNEIKSVVNENDNLVGDLSTLNTTNKSSIVGAINEIYQNNAYSSDEIVIGKTLTAKTPTDEGTWVLVASLPKNIKIKKFDGILNEYLPFPTYVNSNYYIATQFLDTTANTGIQLYVKGYTNTNVEMTIEYIKKTD